MSALVVTIAGKSAENNALATGDALSKIQYLVIGNGTPPLSELFQNQIELVNKTHSVKVLSIKHESPTVMKFTGAVPVDEEIRITEIGIELEDGTLFAYMSYMPETGGLFKGSGMGWTFDTILSREEGNSTLEVMYTPIDVGEIALQIAEDAKSSMDLYLQSYFIGLLRMQTGMSASVLDMQKQINKIRYTGM